MPSCIFVCSLDEVLELALRTNTRECWRCEDGECITCGGTQVAPHYKVVLEKAKEGAPCPDCSTGKCGECSGTGVLLADPHSPSVVASVMIAAVQRMAVARAHDDYVSLNAALDWASSLVGRVMADPRHPATPEEAIASTREAAAKGDELLARVSASPAQPSASALTAEDLAELGLD